MKVERLVLDSNVLISALLVKSSVPAALLTLVLQNHRLVFSRATFDELHTRLWKPKFDKYVAMEDRTAYLNDLSAVAEWVEPGVELAAPICRDVDDQKFIQLALSAGADWLVTGDQDLLVLERAGSVRVVKPADALEVLSAV